jgi:cytochrome c oxidase subunit 3
MLFAAFTSSLVVRRGLSQDWSPLPVPGILWLNTAALLLSSVTLEGARRTLSRSRNAARFTRWWLATTLLGMAFVAGQLLAWRELSERGIYLASNAGSSFFYLLTAAHGVHLLGGIGGLVYVGVRAARRRVSQTAVDAAAIYWHFMDALWVYLIVLLSAERWF